MTVSKGAPYCRVSVETVIDWSMTVSKGAPYCRVSAHCFKNVIDWSTTVSKGTPFCRVSVKTVIDQSMTLFNKLL